jgi:hypothetical protein
VFTEQDPHVAAPRALLTRQACWRAIGQMRREHASVAGIAGALSHRPRPKTAKAFTVVTNAVLN